MSAAKPFDIPKKTVAAAFRVVKSNAGSAGIDKERIGQFESKLKDNLYKIWNRMASGTYYPPEHVNVHDFVDPGVGRATPYGIYDVALNRGWVSVGKTFDTARFAVYALRQWWFQAGKAF